MYVLFTDTGVELNQLDAADETEAMYQALELLGYKVIEREENDGQLDLFD